jgi:acyl-CoA thioester hydrolase
VKLRVYYEDTDIGGVVYYANYLKFCERARSELFFKKGLSPYSENQFFVVKHFEADYLKPAVFGDIIEVKTTLFNINRVSLELLQEIIRDDEVIFKAKVKLAFLKNNKPSKIPQHIVDIF